MKPIQSLSDFVKQIQSGKVRVGCIYHMSYAGRDENGKPVYKDEDRGVRDIAKVEKSYFSLWTPRLFNAMDFAARRCYWPTDSNCKVEDNKVTIYRSGKRIISYWID